MCKKACNKACNKALFLIKKNCILNILKIKIKNIKIINFKIIK